MSSSIRDLFDCDLILKITNCGMNSVKSAFHKISISKGDHISDCEKCEKIQY